MCALAVGVYLASVGSEGLNNIAVQCTSKAHYMAKQLEAVGYQTENKGSFFHEFVTVSETPAEKVLSALEAEGILGGYPLDEHRILWCCTEMNSKADIDRAVAIIKEV